jgi:DNA-binding NarL/FixJ family response regulator
MEPLRVLIADDHPLFRDGLRLLLETLPDVTVLGEASTGEEAVEMARALAPDVVVMDLRLPGISGIEATRRILTGVPSTRVLIVTMFEDDSSVFTAMRAGARGYILKDAMQDDVIRAIRGIGRGEAIFSPTIATRVLDYFASAPNNVPRETFPMLTDREREILAALVARKTNAEIADALFLTPKTVSNYVSNILQKLQVADRAEAILRAKEAGFGG